MFQKIKRRFSNHLTVPSSTTTTTTTTIINDDGDDDKYDEYNDNFNYYNNENNYYKSIINNNNEENFDLTADEIYAIRNMWNVLRKDLAGFKFLGAELFVRFFTKYPDYQQKFKSFKDVPINFQQTNNIVRVDKKLMAHGTYVMYTIGMLVDNLENPIMMKQIIKRLSRNHYRRHINILAFEQLRDTFIEHLIDSLGRIVMNKSMVIAWRKTFNYLIEEIDKNFKQLETDLERTGSYYRLNSLHHHAKYELIQDYRRNYLFDYQMRLRNKQLQQQQQKQQGIYNNYSHGIDTINDNNNYINDSATILRYNKSMMDNPINSSINHQLEPQIYSSQRLQQQRSSFTSPILEANFYQSTPPPSPLSALSMPPLSPSPSLSSSSKIKPSNQQQNNRMINRQISNHQQQINQSISLSTTTAAIRQPLSALQQQKQPQQPQSSSKTVNRHSSIVGGVTTTQKNKQHDKSKNFLWKTLANLRKKMSKK